MEEEVGERTVSVVWQSRGPWHWDWAGERCEREKEENIQNLARLFHGRGRHADESVSNKVLTVSNGETWQTRLEFDCQ